MANSFYQHHHHHGNGNSNMSSSNPLFSFIVTLCLLILLYFPRFFLALYIHPLFLCILTLLVSLLTLFGGSQQRSSRASNRVQAAGSSPDPERFEADSHYKEDPIESNPGPKQGKTKIDHRQQAETPEHDKNCAEEHGEEPGRSCLTRPEFIYRENFVEWDVGAPLDIIYEAYEGEEEGHEDGNDAFKGKAILSKCPSFSGYYLESDVDSDWESHTDSGSSLLSWDGEFQGDEGLIEIEIHHGDDEDYDDDDDDDVKDMKIHDNDDDKLMRKKMSLEVDEVDEDNLIEIDVSLPRSDRRFSY